MSSKGSARSGKRRATQTQTWKLNATIEGLKGELGQARMGMLNMRQMYRQAEQEIFLLRQQISKAETLTGAVMYALGEYSVVVKDEDVEALADEFARLSSEQTEDGALIVLVPHEDIEEDDDADVSEVHSE